MSVQDLPSDPETTPEPDERIIRRLVRALDYSKGFWLGFAKSNTPAQRRRLAALCRDLLEPLKIRVLEIELNEPVTDLLPVLRERLAQEGAANNEGTATDEVNEAPRPKLAIFVHGLERSIPSREAYPPLLSALNLKRELFRQEVPHPLLLWLPDYALTALARKAPDFWAWRSGLYEFAPEREAAEQSFNALGGEEVRITENLSKQAKRERLTMLRGLLDDYHELGNGQREQNACENILNQIGVIHGTLGEWAEARRALEESLKISRKLEDGINEGVTLHNLGRIAHELDEIEEARRLYNESLNTCKRLSDQHGIATALHHLGVLAGDGGREEEARRLYNESLEIRKGLGDLGGVAITLHTLANLASREGDLREARRLYNESLKITEELGDKINLALLFGNLGLLAEREGDTKEAARLFGKSLDISESLGSPYAEVVRRSLARVKDPEDISD
jgi:tetratricopeptide (TPR) repeat protein